MSEKPPPKELIELPLSHKETWDSVDKGGAGNVRGEAADKQAARQPVRDEVPGRQRRQSQGSSPPSVRASSSRSASGRPVSRQQAPRRLGWKVWVLLLALAGLAYWLFWPSAPRVEFSVSPLDFPQLRAGRESEPVVVIVSNAGERVLRIDSVGVVRGELDDFVTEAEDCSRVELQGGGECRVSVRFSPQADGVRSGQLAVFGNMRGKQAVLPLSGEAVAPKLAARPELLDFGAESVDATSPGRDLELVNAGSARLEIDRVTVESPDGEFRLIGNDCSSKSLEPGETCGLRLVFRPALMGRRTAEIAVLSDSFGDARAITLEGRGSGPDLQIEPEGLSFSRQLVGTRSAPSTLKLINRGDAPYRINRAWIESGSAFSVDQENCSGASLAPSKSCRVVVVFEPRAEGEAKTSLQIRESSGAMAPGIGISGVGISPRLEVSASALGFGAVPVGESTDARSLRLTNAGTAALSISQLQVSGGDAASFATGADSCSGTELAPNERCQVEFEFRPLHAGEHQASLEVSSNQRGRAPKVDFTGHGQAPELALDRRRLDFAAVRQTESQDLRVEVSNTGDAPLRVGTVLIGGTAAADFELASNACSQGTLASGNNCRLVVRFVPRANGRRDARLIVQSDAAPGRLELVIRGVGLAPPVSGIAVSPRALEFGSWQVGDRSEVMTIEISSTGAGQLEIADFRLAGADAGDFRIVPGTCQGLPYVAPDGECTVGVRFNPRSVGPRTATLVIDHNAPQGPVSISLRAEAF